jgi:hypothetical protein
MKAALLALVAAARNTEMSCDGDVNAELRTALQAAEQCFTPEEITEADADIYEREWQRDEAERQRRSPTSPETGLPGTFYEDSRS